MAVRSLERSNDKTDEQREIDALLNYSSLSQLLRTWQPVSFIAEGKSGSVFRVKNRQNGLLAAMKFSASPKRLSDCATPGSDADYLNLNDYNDNCHEVEMMSRLQGKPHVIPFIDQPEFLKLTFANKDGEQVCQHAVLIVMPLCMNNAVWMPQASACIEGRMKLALHVSMALAGYESEGIRHRDIKPGNILYSYDGNFYLSDAGEAKAQSEKTTVGLRGTFAYMAPEVFSLNGQSLHRADPRSDIYSLGIVLYQLFNDGQLPFRDAEGYLTDDAVASLNRSRQMVPDRSKMQLRSHEQLAIDLRQSGHVPPPPAHADAEMTGIILRCIAYSPDQRYQSAQSLYQDLDAYCLRHAVEANAFLVAPPAASGVAAQKKPKKKSSGVSGRTVAIAGCSAALVALLGAGAALWLSAPEGTIPSPTATPYITATPDMTAVPTATVVPTWTPTVRPTNAPTAYVTSTPVITSAPTATPKPTAPPTAKPTATPTPRPTATPTPKPTATPTPRPTPRPTATPTPKPTATPTPKPTATPTPRPTATPAVTPMSLLSLQQDYQLPERQQMKVSGHLNMPVYTGPGTDFARAAKKKAVVDSGGAIWCYGKVGNWYLVEYEVTGGDHKGSYRRGYIDGAKLKVNITANENQIDLINLPVVITQKTGVTDEPYKGRKNLCTVNKGSTGTLLFFDGDDACIQMKGTSAGMIQGYVPISCIALQNPSASISAPTTQAALSVKEGQIVTFGTYQNENVSWYVAEIDNASDTALLVSRYAVDVVKYHSSKNTTRWAQSDLRKWLNNTFYTKAFSVQEQEYIVASNIEGVEDRVYILSQDEVEQYMHNMGNTLLLYGTDFCYTTKTATGKAIYVNKDTGGSPWWLRSATTSGTANLVRARGDQFGGVTNPPTATDNGVRPAVRVSLDLFC